MKRYFTFVLAMVFVYICMVPCLNITASADSSGTEESNITAELIFTGKEPFEKIIWAQERSLQLNFGNLENNSGKTGATCYVTPGKTVLKINYCTWDSGRTIAIGFLKTDGLDGGDFYSYSFSSGHITSVNLQTGNLPTGNYIVYVKNFSGLDITSGILDYEVTG